MFSSETRRGQQLFKIVSSRRRIYGTSTEYSTPLLQISRNVGVPAATLATSQQLFAIAMSIENGNNGIFSRVVCYSNLQNFLIFLGWLGGASPESRASPTTLTKSLFGAKAATISSDVTFTNHSSYLSPSAALTSNPKLAALSTPCFCPGCKSARPSRNLPNAKRLMIVF